MLPELGGGGWGEGGADFLILRVTSNNDYLLNQNINFQGKESEISNMMLAFVKG